MKSSSQNKDISSPHYSSISTVDENHENPSERILIARGSIFLWRGSDIVFNDSVVAGIIPDQMILG